MYKYKNYELNTSLNEMTIGEFETVSSILNDASKSTIEKYIDVISYLGLPDNEILNLTDEELFDIIASFDKNELDRKLLKSFVINEVTYNAYEGDEFKLKAKDLSLIEKRIKDNKPFFSYSIAVIFKPENTELTVAYLPKLIENRVKLVKELNAAEYYPYMVYLTDKVISKTKLMTNV